MLGARVVADAASSPKPAMPDDRGGLDACGAEGVGSAAGGVTDAAPKLAPNDVFVPGNAEAEDAGTAVGGDAAPKEAAGIRGAVANAELPSDGNSGGRGLAGLGTVTTAPHCGHRA